MAAILLIPGFGGQYTSETFSASSTAGADTIDAANCDEIAVQVSSTGAPGGDFQIEQTFNREDWVSLGTPISAADGTVSRFDVDDQPFGLLRINPAGITAGTAEAVTITLTGFNRNRS